jgi:hypothetical protein
MPVTNKQDPLVESLISLAVSAAPLIERARQSGIFKPGSRADAAADVIVTPAPEAPPAAAETDGQKSALQDIIVSQAMKIARLEAEIEQLRAERQAKA